MLIPNLDLKWLQLWSKFKKVECYLSTIEFKEGMVNKNLKCNWERLS